MNTIKEGTRVKFEDGWDGNIYEGIYMRNPATGILGVMYGDGEFIPEKDCVWIKPVENEEG